MSKPVLSCKDLSKIFVDGERTTHVLSKLNLTIEKGERVAIVGSSGSGKSTLLHLLGGLDTPSSGEVCIGEHKLHELNEERLCQLRNAQLGFIYQFHHLLGEFTVLENVCMPLLIRGEKPKVAKEAAFALLEKIGLAKRVSHRPGEISGGEKQRVAIARALVTNPSCLLADEPTGNLDHATAEHVFEILMELHKETNTSCIIVTHDPWLAKKMDRTLHMQDGMLV